MARGDIRLREIWDAEIDGDIRKFTADLARDVLADEQAAGFDPEPLTIVDGRYGAQPESVKSFGKIDFAARVDVREAAEWVWAELFRRSPVATGRFQDSNIVMVNGTSVDDLTELKPTDRVQFTDTQPYAGKIERGSSLMAPNGVYRATAAAARNRFKAVFVDFKWVKLDLNVRAATVNRKTGQSGTRAIQYPSIQLYQAGDSAGGGSDE